MGSKPCKLWLKCILLKLTSVKIWRSDKATPTTKATLKNSEFEEISINVSVQNKVRSWILCSPWSWNLVFPSNISLRQVLNFLARPPRMDFSFLSRPFSYRYVRTIYKDIDHPVGPVSDCTTEQGELLSPWPEK